jgi:DNA repair protein SbcD/Mre11
MKRVAVVADSHFHEHSRFDECIAVHKWIAEDAGQRGVDLVVHTGDLYERKSTPAERQAAADWIQLMADFAPVVIVRGNHDAIGDLPLLERLRSTHPIQVVETVAVLTVAGIVVGCLGWPQRANLHMMLPGSGREAVELESSAALRAVLRGLGAEIERYREAYGAECPTMLAAHAMIDGSRVSTGQPLVGCDFSIGLSDLALANAGFYALGHVHCGNDWDIAGAPAVYPGSPRRTSFGELEAKHYVIAEHDGECWTYERIETPARRMVHLEARYSHGTLEFQNSALVSPGCEVRLRYYCQRGDREAARAIALAVEKGLLKEAHSVKLEECLVVESRARAPEVAEAKTLPDRLDAYWKSKSVDVGERRSGLFEKVNVIETESFNAT